MAKISNCQYAEERCNQCKHLLTCCAYIGFVMGFSRMHRENPNILWANRLEECREGGGKYLNCRFEWEDQLTEYDFEEEVTISPPSLKN